MVSTWGEAYGISIQELITLDLQDSVPIGWKTSKGGCPI